jgi:hypothetical protein
MYISVYTVVSAENYVAVPSTSQTNNFQNTAELNEESCQDWNCSIYEILCSHSGDYEEYLYCGMLCHVFIGW